MDHAHEIGHLLLEANGLDNHTTDWGNIMFHHTNLIDADPPFLFRTQVETMKGSPYCGRC
jgi:hypothetical protein